MKIDFNYLNYKNEIIENLVNLIKIKTVEANSIDNKPFGEGCYQGLKYLEELAIKLGFKVTNYDNYALEIIANENGSSEDLAILAHVDVVPEGTGWNYDPYGGIIANNKIYGRGTLDDKGPLIINLFALKSVIDKGLKINKKIRFIVGANEETGSKCMDYYFNTLKKEQPTLAFTPDADFPLIYAEKGIIRIKLKFNTSNEYNFNGGNAFNAVADYATFTWQNKNINIVEKGKSAHAMCPEKGDNAIIKLLNSVSELPIDKETLKTINYLKKIDMDGNIFNINCSDESGKLTLNIGFIKQEKNQVELGIDIRVPVSFKLDDIINKISTTLQQDNILMEVVAKDEPLYVDKQSFLVTKLMDVYKEITGDNDAEPLAIGGGTYARSVTNGVAFGALLKNSPNLMHQPDECIDIDSIETLFDIYSNAIYELVK